MVLGRFYKQLSQVGDRLAECTNGLIERESLDLFRLFPTAPNACTPMRPRCANTRCNLDLYQSRINVRQNRIIQEILTILSAIFIAADADRRLVRHEFLRHARSCACRTASSRFRFSAAAVVAAELIVFKREVDVIRRAGFPVTEDLKIKMRIIFILASFFSALVYNRFNRPGGV